MKRHKKRNIGIILAVILLTPLTSAYSAPLISNNNNSVSVWQGLPSFERMNTLVESIKLPEPAPVEEVIPEKPIGVKITDTAMEFLGVPYVWGGTTPKGFDCSGLVQYVYKMNEIVISRTTYTQVNEGVAVIKEQLQPGDLVFFGNKSSPHHVGIYIGDNKMIHAPKTGDVVKISNISDRRDYATARRITERKDRTDEDY